MSECRSCGAPVLWAVSEKGGKKMPLDADPDNPKLAWRVPEAGVCQVCRGKCRVPVDGEVEGATVECDACTGTGKVPLEPGQMPGRAVDTGPLGNMIFTKQRTGDGTPIVRYVKTGKFLLRSHFATCQHAPSHRKANKP